MRERAHVLNGSKMAADNRNCQCASSQGNLQNPSIGTKTLCAASVEDEMAGGRAGKQSRAGLGHVDVTTDSMCDQ